jgi:large subunit ribosomal protein L21
MYAIIEDSGTQFKVTTGDTIQIDRQVGEKEKTVTFDRVLLVGGEGEPKVGAPLLSGVTVTAEVVGPKAGPKITTVKHKRRKGYYKRIGHRQKFTAVKISAINA